MGYSCSVRCSEFCVGLDDCWIYIGIYPDLPKSFSYIIIGNIPKSYYIYIYRNPLLIYCKVHSYIGILEGLGIGQFSIYLSRSLSLSLSLSLSIYICRPKTLNPKT